MKTSNELIKISKRLRGLRDNKIKELWFAHWVLLCLTFALLVFVKPVGWGIGCFAVMCINSLLLNKELTTKSKKE